MFAAFWTLEMFRPLEIQKESISERCKNLAANNATVATRSCFHVKQDNLPIRVHALRLLRDQKGVNKNRGTENIRESICP